MPVNVIPRRLSFSEFKIEPISLAALHLSRESVDYAAARCSFFYEIAPDYLAEIINHQNLPAARAAAIFDNNNLVINKAKSIFSSDYISIARIASIFNSENLSLGRLVEILGSFSADKAQAVLYHDNLSIWRLIEIVSYGAPDTEISSDTTISGVNRYGDIIIDSAATLSIDSQPGVLLCDYIENNGVISKIPTGAAGGNPGAGVGKGGDGGGGLIIISKSFKNNSTIKANGQDGESGGTTASTADGSAGSDGQMERVGTDTAGSGGDGGEGTSGASGSGNVGGGGGGSNTAGYGKGGNGGDITYINNNSILDLVDKLKKAIADWYLINVLGKTPTSTTDFPNSYGAGGGGGGDENGAGDCGGGGGSGGHILVLAESFENTGTIEANGGAGGNGGSEAYRDSAGGGGGGGIVYVLYKTLINQGTLQALGGDGGTGDYNGGAGGNGVAKAFAI